MNSIVRRWALLLVLAPAILLGQGSQLPKYTVATLPSPLLRPTYTVQVIDGSTNIDCTVGGGSFNVLCVARGNSWVAVANTGSTSYPGVISDGTNGMVVSGTLSALKYGNLGTPLSADPACTATVYWIAPVAGTTNKWRQCTNGQLTNMGSLPPTAALETNYSVPFAQPATGVSTYNGVLCMGDSTGGNECQWFMDATGSSTVGYQPSGNIANAGDTAADATYRLFSRYAAQELNNPVVTMKIGTNDGNYWGHVGDGSGGTGTTMGFYRFTDSAATWATLIPQEKRPTTMYPFTTAKVIVNGTTVTLQVGTLAYAHTALAVNTAITLSGFTTNTGLNGRVWHIGSRNDYVASATQITLTEPCNSGCASATESGNIALAYWTNSGFVQDNSLGNGQLRNSGNPALSTTTSGSTLTTPTCNAATGAYDCVWIGASGMLFVWYYAFNGGTGTFQVRSNGTLLTDYFTGQSTISNNSAPNMAQNNGTAANPVVALAAFTGLPGTSFSQVQITAVNAGTGVGKIGIVAVGSPWSTDSGNGAGGTPILLWSGPHPQCTASVCGPSQVINSKMDFYNDAALKEAVRLGQSIANGGWGLSVRPIDTRSAENNSWSFINPGTTTQQDATHLLQIPGHTFTYRAYARAAGFSASGGNAAQFLLQSGVNGNDYAGFTCAGTIWTFNGGTTSETLPNCPPGKLMYVMNNGAATGAQTMMNVKNPDGVSVVQLYPAEWALLVSINPGGWTVIEGAGYNKFFDRGVYAGLGGSGSFAPNRTYKYITSQGATIDFSTLTGANALPAGYDFYIKNVSTYTIPLTGMSGGDLPATVGSGQTIHAWTNGNNNWYNLNSQGPSLAVNQVTFSSDVNFQPNNQGVLFCTGASMHVNFSGLYPNGGPYWIINSGTGTVTFAAINGGDISKLPATLAAGHSIGIVNAGAVWYPVSQY